MQKTTKNGLGNQLGTYAALAASIAGLSDAEGQIIYTDIADQTVNPGDLVFVDVDQNGIGEFLFGTNTNGNFNTTFPVSSNNPTFYNSNAFIAVTAGPFTYPVNLSSGDPIDAGQAFVSFDRGDLNYSSCAFTNSQFCDGNDGFMGVRIEIGTDTH